MGLFEKIFQQKAATQIVSGYFKTFSGYTPAFTSRSGGLYEMELTRSAVNAFATLASKLKPEVLGDKQPWLKDRLANQPNEFMDTTKFIARIATTLSVDTTAFIVPILDDYGNITGYYPLYTPRAELVNVADEVFLRYHFPNGKVAAIELAKCGILTQFQYSDDFFGSGNAALSPTLDLLNVQRQGMAEGIKSSAAIRFLAKLGQVMRPEDITKERDRFSRDNLSSDNQSGVMMFDSKYADVQPIQNKQFVIDADQMKLIQTNVYNYFGVNEKILQNSYDENQWNAFYEGKIEPFALQLGLVMTNMTFTEEERKAGAGIMFSSNRLQYASNSTKLAVTRDLADRGLISNFGAADIWNLPHPPGEERWVIRGEYIDINNLPSHTVDNAKDFLKPDAEEEEV